MDFGGATLIPDVPREAVLKALERFDQEHRDTSRWEAWEDVATYKHAIDHEGKHYPVKEIISLATGAPKSNFSGGPVSNTYLKKRGFTVIRIRDDDNPIGRQIEEILAGYLEAKISEQFGGSSTMGRSFDKLKKLFSASAPVSKRPQLKVGASCGQGNWAAVPWLAFLDSRETASTKRGVYPVIPFSEDMSGVYLTLNQGVMELINSIGRPKAYEQLHENAEQLGGICENLTFRGFSLDRSMQLSSRSGLGKHYENGTVAHKLYPKGDMPADEEILEDLEEVLMAYDSYLEGKGGHWLFQANPKFFDIDAALQELPEITWGAKGGSRHFKPQQTGFIWRSGPEAGVVAMGTLLTGPEELQIRPEEERFERSSTRVVDTKNRVTIRIDRVLSKPILRKTLLRHPILKNLGVLRSPQGTSYVVTEQEYKALCDLDDTRKSVLDLQQMTTAFSEALRASNLDFGTGHERIVRAFVASLASKPFAILTGLSGSGKTQIAIRFGEWLGGARLHVAAVRPDWTGAEALFGYEDALKKPVNGRCGWTVPAPLEFLLMAAGDRSHPYVLLLDEMNLAHVERYFADVLSGMESRKECLPNLVREQDGCWRERENAPARIPFPFNVIVIGTVNVDETTYMFSPKVLDRANTFEFRVATEDLSDSYRQPTECLPGDAGLVRGFLEISQDSSWQETYPYPEAEELGAFLRKIHELLARHGFEFGHRIFYESFRFAAMHASAGDGDIKHVLDRIVMQKLLPRLHGSRRRLDTLLCECAGYCFALPSTGEASQAEPQRFEPADHDPGNADLPASFEKLRRMVVNLRANQFTSFAE